MTDFDPFEKRFAAALRSEADDRVGEFDPGAVADAAIAGTVPGPADDPRASSRPTRRSLGTRGITLLAAAALLLVGATLVAGSSVLRQQSFVPRLFGPAPVETPTASELAATSPSPEPSALSWTPANLKEDWPAPVRTEPAGPPVVVPIQAKTDTSRGGHYEDPAGDAGTADFPWPDITDVSTSCRDICLQVTIGGPPVGNPHETGPTPVEDPKRQWVAYGVVTDDDGDGVADWRYGVDNVPVGTPDAGQVPYRWWRTNLHTGKTEWAVGEHVYLQDGPMFYGTPGWLVFGGEVAGRGTTGGLPARFYVWASVIQDGRVVGTDYAPDAGWLHPALNAGPAPSPTSATESLADAGHAPCPGDESSNACVEPGPYRLGPDVLPRASSRIVVPAGWFEWDMGRGTEGLLVNRADAKDGSGWGVIFSSVGTVSTDPCDAMQGTVPDDAASSVTGLIAAMQRWPGFEVGASQSITVSGLPATRVAVTSTRTQADCPDAVLWRTPQGTGFDAYPMVGDQPGAYTAQLTLVDIAGGVLAIRTTDFAQTSPAELSQGVARDPRRHEADQVTLHAILDSLQLGNGS